MNDIEKIDRAAEHYSEDNPGDPVVTPWQLICWADEARQGARFHPSEFLDHVPIPAPNIESWPLGTTFRYHDDNAARHLFMVAQKTTGTVFLQCALHGTGSELTFIEKPERISEVQKPQEW